MFFLVLESYLKCKFWNNLLATFGDGDQSYIGPFRALNQVELNHGGYLLVDFNDPVIGDLLEQGEDVVLRKKTRKANATKWVEMKDVPMDEVCWS
ncbi:L-type lectin-domain containing receptor kinase VIII.2-like [Pyrus ussuriensis x Pyrus communis]|uniref:L-type lectin-domain containing receptor kinase VIII.2-like n=1 Tax=Pyrus ussuriensis x Pyrus communis TaxID=2448454 RepID=A0A5N5FPL1_9ROSA|nr:L-type lectin-domain containing receptor kinase VIII.2-like [Pyrus ussuriensis x Pyrus communis]